LNTQDFIESGVLESYMLGFASKQEQDYILKMVSENSHLEEYLIDMETDVQHYFQVKAVPPPPELREVIVLRNPETEIVKKKHVFSNAKTQEPLKKETYLDIEVNDTHIKVHKYWRPAFIAVFVLSKIFLIAGLYYYFKSASLEAENAKLRTEIRPNEIH
jgi:hypothetical protein